MLKLLWGFETQIYHLNLVRKPDLVIVNKKEKNIPNCRLCHPGGSQYENQKERKERQVFGPCQRTKRTLEHDDGTNYNSCTQNDPQMLDKGAGRVGNRRTTELLISARILRRVMETCCFSDSIERPSVTTGVKNSQGVI